MSEILVQKNRKTLKQILQILLNVIGYLIARFLGITTQIFLARKLGTEGFGIYTALYATLNPVIVVTNLGLDTWFLKQSSNQKFITKFTSRIFETKMLLLFVLLLILLPFIRHHYYYLDILIVIFVLLSVLADTFLTTADTVLRSSARTNESISIQITVSSMLLFIISIDHHLDVLSIFVYRLITVSIGSLISYWLLRSIIHWIWQPRQWVNAVKLSRFYFISDIMAFLTLRVDLFFISLLLPTIDAARYAPALNIINTTFLIPGIVSAILLPIMVKQSAKSKEYKKIVLASIALSIIYGLICFSIISWQSAWLVHLLYGANYSESVKILQIMAIIPLLKALNFCWTTLMVANDHQPLRVRLQLVGAVTSLVGTFVIIPIGGVIGVAWINVLTEVSLFLAYGYGALRTYRGKMR